MVYISLSETFQRHYQTITLPHDAKLTLLHNPFPVMYSFTTHCHVGASQLLLFTDTENLRCSPMLPRRLISSGSPHPSMSNMLSFRHLRMVGLYLVSYWLCYAHSYAAQDHDTKTHGRVTNNTAQYSTIVQTEFVKHLLTGTKPEVTRMLYRQGSCSSSPVWKFGAISPIF